MGGTYVQGVVNAGRQASSRVDISGQPWIGCVDLILHRESNPQPICSSFQMRVAFYCVTVGELTVLRVQVQ